MKRIHNAGTGEVVEKKSRFIADVYDLTDEEQALHYINETKKKYWDARHHCYAYVIGEKNEIKRFSDDGEPSGTAGKPILEVIDRSGVCNCLIIVTRYFGGTLLGTGGLIRAYTAAAKAGLDNAGVMEVRRGVTARIDADYNSLGKLQYICVDEGAVIRNIDYSENVQLELLIELSAYADFQKLLADVFGAKLSAVKINDVIYGVFDGEVNIISENCE